MKKLLTILLPLTLIACSSLPSVPANRVNVTSRAVYANTIIESSEQFKCHNFSYSTLDNNNKRYSYLNASIESGVISGIKNINEDFTRKFYVITDATDSNINVCELTFDNDNMMIIRMNNGKTFKQYEDE